MKVILSWLGDPFLHLVGIVAIVVAIGSAVGSESSSAKPDRCELCRGYHDESRPCPRLASTPGAPGLR